MTISKEKFMKFWVLFLEKNYENIISGKKTEVSWEEIKREIVIAWSKETPSSIKEEEEELNYRKYHKSLNEEEKDE